MTRAKRNMDFHRVYSHPADKGGGHYRRSDHALDGFRAKKDYPWRLRRVRFCDPETGKKLVFLTNSFEPPAATIAALYKKRWQVKLSFKRIKQNLRIKHFFGT